MSSISKQKEKILKLKVKDKKLARLFNAEGLSDRDIYFLNLVYEERNIYHFRYAVALSFLVGMTLRLYMKRRFSSTTANLYAGGIILGSHFFWTSIVTNRFRSLTEPYFQKYQVK